MVSTRPQQYHSVRIDQRQHRAIHVLPEKYQFCALGAARPENSLTSSSSVFGRCRAKVHYGICSDFDVFVVNESATTPASPALSISSATNRFTYSVKTPSIQAPNAATAKVNTPKPLVASMGGNRSSGGVRQPEPQSALNRSMTARIESYRENLGAALQLFNEYDEPAQLQNLIR